MKKILVVDDDKDILDAIQIILESEGYTVSTIPKGNETYQAIDEFRPDIILLDVLMSGSDGRTICKNLKKDSKKNHIPVIMLSAHPTIAKEAFVYGANDFLAKPFETEDLLKIIKKNLH